MQYNLGWKLALVLKGEAAPSLLSSYSIERGPIVAHVLGLSSYLHDLIINSSGMSPFERPMELRQLGVNYRFSPIVIDERGDLKQKMLNLLGYITLLNLDANYRQETGRLME